MTEGIAVNNQVTQGDVLEIPSELPVLPLDQFVLFPAMVAPIIVGEEKSKELINEVVSGPRLVGVFTKKIDAPDANNFDNIYHVGTAAKIVKMVRTPDGIVRVLLHGIARIRIVEPLATTPYLKARVEELREEPTDDIETQALVRSIQALLGKAVQLSAMPEELATAVMNLTDPGRLADLVATNLPLKIPELIELLSLTSVRERIRKVHYLLTREMQVLELGTKIRSQVKSELDKTQREYYLREQLKAIRKELGEDETTSREIEELQERVKQKALPQHAREVAEKELNRLRLMQPASPEYTVTRTYLDWILELPWLESTEDTLDIKRAKRILDEDHYDLDKIKERILEYLSVRKLKNDMKGPILCFVGPPGVGKTSLGRSIARAVGRKFVRIALGGMRDEAEIRGHRRTYIGAMPGRIIKAIKSAGANNPVLMLDEIDKLGSDYRGDPAAALLEVLDPEQNNSFVDNYLDIPFDLSNVMFITTANHIDPVPGPLRDRMEVIELPGYSLGEKLQIAKRYIIPKQIENNGLRPEQCRITDSAVIRIIDDYTREAGLRNLEREIAAVCRKVARRVAETPDFRMRVTPRNLSSLLGPPRYYSETAQRMGLPGVAVGLAWTPTGGEILFIEASLTPGSGRFTLTGQLGEVMRESAQAALTYLRANATRWQIPDELFSQRDIHIHVPAGAVPKDGPSAGITICTALASLLTNRLVKDYLAMTGEITLKGNVLPVGGIKEKVLAAARAKIQEIILPERNMNDLDELPPEIREKLQFHPVKHVQEVLDLALGEKAQEARSS
ncbi:MAG: endopeptidase La [Candidatus Sumerlaeaceae bacterium]